MKKAYVTFENIKKGVTFLEKRKVHAAETGNDEWVGEYENAIRIIRGLCTLELSEACKKKAR